MKTLLSLLMAALLASPVSAQENSAPKGTIIIYIENRQDRFWTGDFLMDAGIAYFKRRLEARLSETLPSSRYRIFTGADYVSGAMQRFFDGLAASGEGGPIDLMTLSHSGGETVETPCGDKVLDEFFKQIPKVLEPRLRLFYNAGCYGADAHASALIKGFVVSVGTEQDSIGPTALDEFLVHYLKGDTAIEAARRVNAAVAGSNDWTVPFLTYKVASGDQRTRKQYSQESSLKVHTHSRRAEAARLATSSETLPGMRSAPEKKRSPLWDSPDTLLNHEPDLLPDPIEGVSVRSVVKRGQRLDNLPTRLRVDFDGSEPFLPEYLEVDVKDLEITKARVSPFKLFDNSALAYERDLDRGIKHEIEAIRVEVPLVAYSAGDDHLFGHVVVMTDIEAGFRHRKDNNTGYAQLHGRAEAMLEIERTLALGGRADAWLSIENTGLRCDVELSCGARVRLDEKGARLDAGYSRFYSDIFNRRRDSDDDFDAFLIGVTVGR